MNTKYITNPMLHIIVLFYSSMYVLFNYVCYECLEIRYGVAFHCFCSVFVPSASVFDPPTLLTPVAGSSILDCARSAG